MKDKIVFISGSTDGIGKRAALELAKQGAKLILHGRNPEKLTTTISWLQQETGIGHIDSVLADMASFDSIKEMSKQLHSRFDHIDVLVNNAGVQQHNYELSADGYESTFAINHLGYFLTTHLLLDLVMKSEYKRIVIVSSGMHYRVDRLDFDLLFREEGYSLYTNYAHSKLANLLFGYKLARMLDFKGITVNCLHPGLVDTNLNPSRSPEIVARALPVEKGIISLMRLVTDPSLAAVSGKYVNELGEIVKSSSASYIEEDQDRLWTLSEKLIGEKFTV
ncbi:MAG: SDR family oxidoreductase [Candidatus Heimdallarchaeota archaeon]|nr:SDR family oxidoreductase [Candidatus Heimdallarchaeota archaeon]